MRKIFLSLFSVLLVIFIGCSYSDCTEDCEKKYRKCIASSDSDILLCEEQRESCANWCDAAYEDEDL